MYRTDWRIRNLSSWTMLIFGVLAFILGLIGIIRPETMLQLLNFEVLERSQRASGDYSVVFLTASSMASFNMGIYYILAALTNWKAFYWWTVPFRMVTFAVFTLLVMNGTAPQGFIGVGLWELVGALLTGSALLYESKAKTKTSTI
jgi:hypothetical protein